jgi:predicted branched-subunit amino acid permease
VAAHRPALLSTGRGATRVAFLEGARDALPALLAVVPFGLVTGVAAASVLTVAQAIGMSYLMFAGSAQLAALQLIGLGSPFVVVLATTLLINLRFALYSAIFAPHLRVAPWPLRALVAATMTDHAMAFASRRFGTHPERGDKVAYFAGLGLSIWLFWTSSSTIGVLVGTALPAGWSLDFAVPLMFLGLWVATLMRGRSPVWVAGGVAAVVAVLARPLPLNAGLLLAAFAGIGAGLWWEHRTARERPPEGGGGP